MTSIRGSSFDSPFWNPSYATPPDGPPRDGDKMAPRNGSVGGTPLPGESRGAVAAHTAATGREQTVTKQELLSELLRWEGDHGHMYLDTKGLVTVGIGNLVPSAADAQRLPFVDAASGKPATPEQIADAFETVKHEGKGRRAEAYADATTLRLPENTIRELAASRLENEFLPGLRRLFSGFDEYPAPAQRALVDIVYSTGVGGLAGFPKLRAACESGDWSTAAAESHRRGARAVRNEWTKDQFLDAAVAESGS